MEIKCLEDYQNGENTYVVKNGGKCVVIDPAYNLDGILRAAGDAEITHIFITHCHYDHILTLNSLREKTGALLVASKYASINIGDPLINLTAMTGDEIVCAPADIIPSDGEKFTAADMEFTMIYTPGHTNGGACYLTGDCIFVGDTLFLRNVGRWDLPTGDEQTLRKSIKEKLYTLDENLKVYPGHGNSSSIGYEKKFNLYVKAE